MFYYILDAVVVDVALRRVDDAFCGVHRRTTDYAHI